jgi:hypothetical protein
MIRKETIIKPDVLIFEPRRRKKILELYLDDNNSDGRSAYFNLPLHLKKVGVYFEGGSELDIETALRVLRGYPLESLRFGKKF